MKKFRLSLCVALASMLLLSLQPIAQAAEHVDDTKTETKAEKPEFNISENVGDAVSRQAGQVREQLEMGARALFQREPLGFDSKTALYLYDRLKALPSQLPKFIQAIVDQSRLLGILGSILVFVFLVAVVYSLLGQKRVMKRVEGRLAPLAAKLPDTAYPYILSTCRILTAALLPLLLLAAFLLIDAMIAYRAVWLDLIGNLLLLWATLTVISNLLREILTRGLFGIDMQEGASIFRPARLIALYSFSAIALYWTAAAFDLREDVLSLLQFAISLSIIIVFFLLLLKKNTLVSMLPDFAHPGYRKFLSFFAKYYFALIILSLSLAVLWVLGYRNFGRVLLTKIWSSVGAYIGIMVVYHLLTNVLKRWHEGIEKEDEAADLVYRSFRSLLIYTTAIATVLVILNLLGLLGLLKQVMSFEVFELGQTAVTFWIILEAALILLAFVFFSRLLQAYLDYRVYPAIGVETGLGYAINTFLKYTLLAIGFLIALNIVGLDLKFFLVFAGAVGIGIGMGLQNMAANVISGFMLIFGGKLRKGDWIEVGGTMGVVTDIHLRATKVRTRDDIEYLIPNTEFISGVLVNYSLGSPLIRIDVPVGVTYKADPRQVKKLLLAVAAKEPLVARQKPPVVRFTEFGDSSINFDLLIWINVRTTPRRKVRSALYFAIFEQLAQAGIEIPFPQRDLHLRTAEALAEARNPSG